jgi:hypothetical protein
MDPRREAIVVDRQIKLNISSEHLDKLDQIARIQRRETQNLRIGVGNVGADIIALVIDKYPQILKDLVSGSELPGLDTDEASPPKAAGRR